MEQQLDMLACTGKGVEQESLAAAVQQVANLHQSAVLEAAVPSSELPAATASNTAGNNAGANAGANAPLPLDLFASGSPIFGAQCQGGCS